MGVRSGYSVVIIPLLLSAAIFVFTEFYMLARARRAGFRIEWVARGEDLEQFPRGCVLRYREVAKNNNLPMWPYHAHIVAGWSLLVLSVLWAVDMFYCAVVCR